MLPRPLRLWKVWIEFFALYSGPIFLGAMALHALGRPTRMARRVVAEAEWPALFWAARAALLLWLAPIALSLALGSWLPVLLFGLPRFYGGALVWLFVVTQHAGMAVNVTDHRLNCRSLRLNPVLSFLFMNMESHTEHHVYPNVPFHALPRLRRLMAPYMPPPYRGLWGAWKESPCRRCGPSAGTRLTSSGGRCRAEAAFRGAPRRRAPPGSGRRSPPAAGC